MSVTLIKGQTLGSIIKFVLMDAEQLATLLKDWLRDASDMLSEHRKEVDQKLSTITENVVDAFDKSSDKIVTEVRGLRTDLVPSATGQNRVDLKAIMPVIYTLCGVICALVVWFTGVRPFLPVPEAPNAKVEIVNGKSSSAINGEVNRGP